MKKFFGLVLPLLMVLLHFSLSFLSVREQSQTFDESVNLVSGYYFLKTGKTYLNPEHPPLISVISSLPLFLLKLNDPVINVDNPEIELYNPKNSKYRYMIANKFIYENRVNHEIILFLGRLPIIILSCILAILIFVWSKKLGGIYAGLLSLSLYALDPNFLAHGQLITMDIGLSLFYTLSSLAYIEYISDRKLSKLLLAGLFFSFSLLTKFPGFLLLIVFFIIATISGYKDSRRLIKNYMEIFLILIFSIIILFIFYRGEPGYYVHSLQYAYNHSKYGDYNFLFGSFSPRGWLYYFIVTFFVKTPLTTLILIFYSIYIYFKNRSASTEYRFILIPCGIFFLASLFSTVNIGHRYILPVYPFIFVFSGILTNNKIKHYVSDRIIVLICITGLIYANYRIYPHYISFFNSIAGGPEKGHKILVDSNIDWGQDLKFLKKFQDENKIDEFYFAYFGSVDPAYYGIRYRFIPSSYNRYIEGADSPYKLKLPLPKSRFLAVSVTYLYESIAYHWLQSIKPTARAGYSIYIYDITNNIPARLNLVHDYLLVDAKETARAELDEILKMYPDNSEALRLKEILQTH